MGPRPATRVGVGHDGMGPKHLWETTFCPMGRHVDIDGMD